jgi:hypothetical protein
MTRDRGQGEFERLGKFPDRGIAPRQLGEDRAPGRIGKSSES